MGLFIGPLSKLEFCVVKTFWSALALAVLLVQSPALAGGSFPVERVIPLLQQDPELYHFLTSTLELSPAGWAPRIGTRVNENLGGTRIAPFTLRAKPKGSSGPWIFLLVIEAESQFLDAAGEPVEIHEWVTLLETLQGVRLESIKESDQE